MVAAFVAHVLVVAVGKPAGVVMTWNRIGRERCPHCANLQSHPRANLRPVKAPNRHVLARRPGANGVPSLGEVSDHVRAPQTQCLPRAAVVGATRLAIAEHPAITDLHAVDRRFGHAPIRKKESRHHCSGRLVAVACAIGQRRGCGRPGQVLAQPCAEVGHGKALTLELGGKAANVVFEDAALDQAVEGVINGIFFNQGEVCCAGSRLLVQESIAEDFIARLKDRMSTLRVGDPMDKNTDVGAINSRAQM